MSTIRPAKRLRYAVVSNDMLQDERLSYRARGILAWLLSMPDDWSTNSDLIAKAGPEGRDAVRTALRELESFGYLQRERLRHPNGQFETIVTFYETPPAPGNPAAVDQSSEDQASNKVLTPSTETNPSLRSGEVQSEELNTGRAVATAYWDWHLNESGGPPAQDFKALMSVGNACIKREYPVDEILDAWKTISFGRITTVNTVHTIGRLRRERENRPSTAVVPSALLRSLAEADSWFESRWTGWFRENKLTLVDTTSRMIRAGFDVGETMLRLAVAMHDPTNITPIALMRIDGIDRFKGGLADVPGSMEIAYKNRYWRAA